MRSATGAPRHRRDADAANRALKLQGKRVVIVEP
jgi:hypothetical protein